MWLNILKTKDLSKTVGSPKFFRLPRKYGKIPLLEEGDKIIHRDVMILNSAPEFGYCT